MAGKGILSRMRRIFQSKKHGVPRGFTLVEILVISPIVILVLSALIATIVLSTGSAMRSSARSQLQYEVMSALDRIEADVKLSKKISITSSLLSTLNLSTFATDRNPFDTNRQLIDKTTCQPVNGKITVDEAAAYLNQYSVSDGKLERNAKYNTVYAGMVNMTNCMNNNTNIYQQPTSKETLIGDNGVKVFFFYVKKTSAGGVEIILGARKTVAGEDISYAGRLYVKSLNEQ